MRVVEEGNKKQARCDKCNSLLEYWEADIKHERIHINEYKRYVRCPVCDNKLSV